MKARELMKPALVVNPEDSAQELFRAFEDPDIRAVAVVTDVGELAGLISEEDMLNALLPAYVLDDEALARVLEEEAATKLRERLEGKGVKDVVDASARHHPTVDPEDTLVEVAATLARSGDPAVLVVEEDRVLGVITVDTLLPVLLSPRA